MVLGLEGHGSDNRLWCSLRVFTNLNVMCFAAPEAGPERRYAAIEVNVACESTSVSRDLANYPKSETLSVVWATCMEFPFPMQIHICSKNILEVWKLVRK